MCLCGCAGACVGIYRIITDTIRYDAIQTDLLTDFLTPGRCTPERCAGIGTSVASAVCLVFFHHAAHDVADTAKPVVIRVAADVRRLVQDDIAGMDIPDLDVQV